MFKFLTTESTHRCGVVLNVGSGSTAIGLVVSDSEKGSPEIIWSYREPYVSSEKANKVTDKKVQDAISSVFSQLSTKGLKELKTKYPKFKPEVIQVSISAPFSQTIVNKINTKFQKSTKVTAKIIEEMIKKGEEDAENIASQKFLDKKHGLIKIGGKTVSCSINGYRQNVIKSTPADTLSLSRCVGVIPSSLHSLIEKVSYQSLPEVPVDFDTFMSLYYQAVRDLLPDLSDAGFINITGEATEFLLMHNKMPKSSPYVPSGRYSLERELIKKLSITPTEAESILRDNDLDTDKLLPKSKREIYEKIIDDYVAKVTELLSKSGNSFSVPSNVYLHTSSHYESFFSDLIKRAAKDSDITSLNIHSVTSEFFDKISTDDTAISLSAYVFHQKIYVDEEINVIK